MIRKALSRDLDLLKTLSRHVIQNNYAAFLEQDLIDDYINSGDADAEIESNLANMIVFQKAGQILGFCVYFDNLIHLIMVKPERQCQGVGRKLIEHAEKQIFRKFKKMKLQIFDENGLAICFFQRLGFNEVGVIDDKDYGCTMTQMEKPKI